MIQRKYYKTVRVIIDSDGGGTPFYIENVDTVPGYFTLSKNGTPTYTPNLNYRIDNGEWFEYDVVNMPRIEVPVGSKIYLKGNNPNGFEQAGTFTTYYKFNFYSSSTTTTLYCKSNIGGYITSLLVLDNFNLISEIPNYSFYSLFSFNQGLLSAENLITSNITTVGENSLYLCFQGCTSLVTAPTFENVTSVGTSGFSNCFQDCTSLVTAPTFENVTSVGSNGFKKCFYGCTSLVTAPTFKNVTSVAYVAFEQCFQGCTSLETIIAPRPSSWVSSDFTDWTINVPSTGTFYKKKGLDIPTGTSGIPEGWTVVEED